jgi:hypothetical protein
MKNFARLSLIVFLIAAFAGAQTVPIGPGGLMPVTTANTFTDTGSLSNFNFVGLLTGTPTAAANYTTPTAAAACAYFRNIVPPVSTLYWFDWWVKNTSGGANTITIVAGSGFTVVGTATIAQNNVKHFLVNLTNCSSGNEAGNILSVGTSTF